MAGLGRFNLRDLEKFRDKIQRMGETETEAFIQACAKELAARLLRKIIKRTDKVTVTGNLRRGWTGQTKKLLIRWNMQSMWNMDTEP